MIGSELEMWAALTGFGLPLLVAVVNQPTWPAWARGVVALLASLVAGGVNAYLTGDLNGVTLVHAFLVVAFAALGSYRLVWQPARIAPAIEAATSPKVVEGEHY